ncbi:MAG: right-handed parallel beta-helix repeat-containing protein, partial [Gloeomargarita sp. DG02_1_bins_92]
FVYNNQGTINATIRGNTVTVPAGATEVDGIEINLCRSGAPFTACSGAAFGNYVVTGNTVTAPGATGGADGIDFNFGTGANAIAQILNNRISQFPDKAISFGGVGSNNVAALISGNTISNVGDNGIHIRPRENSNFRAPVTVNGTTASGITISNNTITSPGGRGIDVRLDDDGGLLAPNTAQADVTISANTISNSGSDGMRLRTEQGGQLRAVVQNNTVTGSSGGDAGIFVRSENTSQLQATLTGNTVTGATAGDAGILARADNTSTLCIKIQFNTSQNPALAKDFRLRRNAAGANLQLFGITAALPVAANSTPLQTALEGQGNVANVSSNTRFQVQSNPVQVPTALCTFP